MNYIKETACATPVLPPLTGDRLWSGLSRVTTAARRFASDLRASDPLLFHLGWIMQALIPLFAVMAAAYHFSGHAANVNGINPSGINPWTKPIKFATSLSTLLWTLAPMLLALRVPAWQRKAARQAIAFGAVMEMVCLTAQAGRGAYFSGPATLTDAVVFRGTSAMISVITAVCLWMTVLYFFKSRVALADKMMLAAIRFSLVIFMIGNAVGGYMLARGSHTVGAPDGGPGMPFTNWSTTAGDLRVAHFIAIHAIQILPLLAWSLRELMPPAPERRLRLVLYAASAVLSLAVAGAFIQAAMAHPLVPMAQTQQAARIP
ncbi:MAG: hypothetical protein ACHP79_11440 [Terriglobales bacterium]